MTKCIFLKRGGKSLTMYMIDKFIGSIHFGGLRENTNFTTFTDYIIKISSSIAQKISHSTIKRKYD
jgi:hypothetical protein